MNTVVTIILLLSICIIMFGTLNNFKFYDKMRIAQESIDKLEAWYDPIVFNTKLIDKKDIIITPKNISNIFAYNTRALSIIVKDMEKTNKIVYPIIYINLDRSINRRYMLEKELANFNLSAKRISAIDGKNIKNVKNGEENGIKFSNSYKLTKSEMGCTLSHLKAIREAYNSNYENCIILEDDVSLELMPLWKQTIPELLQNIGDWDIVQLTNSSCKFSDKIENFMQHCYGTFAYVINRQGMQKIMDRCFEGDTAVLNYNHPLQPKNKQYGGRADIYIYQCVDITKANMRPLFFPQSIDSTIHTENDYNTFLYSNNIILLYITDMKIPKIFVNMTKITSKQLLPGIDQIFYINLDHRKDRKERFEKELSKMKIPVKDVVRISGVYTPQKGSIGCFESHIKCLELAISKYPGENVLICEDDAVFNQSPEYVRKQLIDFFADKKFSNWDVVMLAHNTYNYVKTHDKNVIRILEGLTASAYLVKASYVKELLLLFNICKKLHDETGVWKKEYLNDQSWIILQQMDKWYGFKPQLLIQGESYSDIEKKIVDYKV